jgi:hypothetical protein
VTHRALPKDVPCGIEDCKVVGSAPGIARHRRHAHGITPPPTPRSSRPRTGARRSLTVVPPLGPSLSLAKTKDLRALARSLSIPRFSQLSRHELLQALAALDAKQEDSDDSTPPAAPTPTA